VVACSVALTGVRAISPTVHSQGASRIFDWRGPTWHSIQPTWRPICWRPFL